MLGFFGMKKLALAAFAAPFLLVISQVVSAQDNLAFGLFAWNVETKVDVIDDSVSVFVSKPAYETETLGYANFVILGISCDESFGYPVLSVSFFDNGQPVRIFDGFPKEMGAEVTHRIGTDDSVTQAWTVSPNTVFYNGDASVLVAEMVQDNSRFVIRVGRVTAIWDIEGLADVIDECTAIFD